MAVMLERRREEPCFFMLSDLFSLKSLSTFENLGVDSGWSCLRNCEIQNLGQGSVTFPLPKVNVCHKCNILFVIFPLTFLK